MKRHCIKSVLLQLWAIVFYLLLSGCDETGEKVEPPSAVTMSFQARVTDPIAFHVYINDELFDGTDPYVKYHLGGVPVRITEVISERVIFDGSFPVRPVNGSFYLTVYQYRSGSVPVCIAPPEEESLPPAGYSKIAFLYNLSDFPEEIKVVVENATSVTSNQYEPTDTLIVRKNEFSDFFLGKHPGERTQVKLYTTGDYSTQIGMIGRDQFANINNDFTMYLIKAKSNESIPQISLEKAY